MIGNAPGAAIPGAFIAMAVAVILGLTRGGRTASRDPAHELVRLAAFGAIGFWFGGEMTYGQMFNFTRNTVANGEYYWWGILGTVVKGGAWQGAGAACIGLGLMRKRYRWQEIAALMLVMTAASAIAIQLLNRPLHPGTNLGLISFSYDPVNPDNAPRTEMWAGPWAGIIVLLLYAGIVKKDRVTLRFGLYGILGGGCGFAVGQMLQAYSWAHPGIAFHSWIDWWKVMELTFGFIGGCAIATAALKTRPDELQLDEPEPPHIPAFLEWTAIVLWLLLLYDDFSCNPLGSYLAPLPFIAGIVIMAGIAAGRWTPWIVIGFQVPAATGLITTAEVMRVYPYDGGWGPNADHLMSLGQLLLRAWPTLTAGALVCSIPMYWWLYRQPQDATPERKQKTAHRIILLFTAFHVLAVFLQMIWCTLDRAESPSQILSIARPYYMLFIIFTLFWFITIKWLKTITTNQAVAARNVEA